MPDLAERLGAKPDGSTLLALFIPSHDRFEQTIEQSFWVLQALEALGNMFGRATALAPGKGVWRDDANGRKLLFDEPVIVECYTTREAIEKHVDGLRSFLLQMGTESHQRAVGIVLDGTYLEIEIPS